MTKTPELYSDLPPLIKAALAVADTGLPVFPTVDKMPAWSNAELGVAKGDGGHIFARTLSEHNANVQKWYALRRERGEME